MKFIIPVTLNWLPAVVGISTILTSSNFTTAIQEGTWFVKFYAPWCRFSKKLAPEWALLASTLDGYRAQNFFFGEVDCDANGQTCSNNFVEGYPTLILFNKGRRVEEFDQDSVKELTAQYISGYVKKQAKRFFNPNEVQAVHKGVETPEKIREDKAAGSFLTQLDRSVGGVDREEPLNTGFVSELDAASFDSKLHSLNPWVVLFYSPNCPHCRALEPLYIEAALASKGRINFSKVNCIENGDFCERKGVLGVPDMRIMSHGNQLDKRVGELSMDKLLKFVRKYYAPVVKRKTIQEVQSLINPAHGDPSSGTPSLVLVFRDGEEALKVRNISDSLIGTSLTSDILMVQDKEAPQAFNLGSTTASAFSIHGSEIIEFPHPLDFAEAFRSWVGSNQFQLANELQPQFISNLELNDYHLVIGMYAKDTDDVMDSHKLRELVLQSNLQYLKTFGRDPTSVGTALLKPTIFSYLKGPIEHELRPAIFPKLKRALEGPSDELFMLVDTSAGQYYYLEPNSEHKFSADAIISTLKDFQLGRLEAQPLVEKAA
ncbi:hypothetical protein L0F63_004824, partial [Massospora cicadina]